MVDGQVERALALCFVIQVQILAEKGWCLFLSREALGKIGNSVLSQGKEAEDERTAAWLVFIECGSCHGEMHAKRSS